MEGYESLKGAPRVEFDVLLPTNGPNAGHIRGSSPEPTRLAPRGFAGRGQPGFRCRHEGGLEIDFS
jgi:hypothetical protein